MTIGENIRKIRRNRGITQGDLAELLHITPQAVSRWETNLTTPDVTSLIGLARIFDCTTDDILGLNRIKKEDRIEYYANIAMRASMNGDAETVIKAWHDALTEFPNDYFVMYNLAHYLTFYADRYRYEKSHPETYTAMMREARQFYEYILEHCTDDTILGNASRGMYDLLISTGEYEAAEEYLDHMPDLWQSRQVAALSYPKKRQEASVALAADAVHLLKRAMHCMICNPDPDEGFPPEDRAEIASKLETLHKLFYDDLTTEVRPDFLLTLACAYANVRDTENTFRCLKIAAELAVEYDGKKYNNGYVYTIHTAPFKGEKRSVTISNTAGDYRDEVSAELDRSCYDFVRNTPEFAEILAIIAK